MKIAASLNSFVGVLLLATGLAIWPVIFDDFFSMFSLIKEEHLPLKITSMLLFFSGLVFVAFKKFLAPVYATFTLSIILLMWIELCFRAVINADNSQSPDKALFFQSNITYPEYIAYKGHPFFHFIGKSNI